MRFEIEHGGKKYEVEAASMEAAAAALGGGAQSGLLGDLERGVRGTGEMVKNIPASGMRLATDLAGAVAHPLDTLSTLQSAIHGGAQHLLPNLIGEGSSLGQSEYAKRSRDVATGVGNFYKGRYGGMNQILNTAITDPVGMAADVSGVGALTGGAARAGASATSQFPRASAALESVADAGAGVARIDPVMAAARAAPALVRGAGDVGAAVLGGITGVGADKVRQGFQSGMQGAGDFLSGARGTLDPARHLERGNTALANYRTELGAQLERETQNIRNINPAFDPHAALNAWSEILDSTTLPTPNTGGRMASLVEGERTIVQTIQAILDNFMANPNLHNYQDARRVQRAIADLYRDSPEFRSSNRAVEIARRAFQDEMQTAKATDTPAIRAARGELRGANGRYSSAIEEANQWEQILKSFANADDTQFRAMTNAGGGNPSNALRQQQFERFQQATGVDLNSGLAGMQMQNLAGPALHGTVLPLAIAGLGTAAGHPMVSGAGAAALALASSPRLVAEGAYRSGQLAGIPGRILERLSPGAMETLRSLPPEVVQALLQGAYQTRGAPAQR